jgi:hypothetical protein
MPSIEICERLFGTNSAQPTKSKIVVIAIEENAGFLNFLFRALVCDI